MVYQNNNYGKFIGGATGPSAKRYGNVGMGTRKPVRSFRDLEIYQKTLECSVLVVKDLVPDLEKLNYSFRENMVNCAMSVPLFIGEAHSLRFVSFEGGVMLLEKSMAGCNKMIVYLEQMKGVYGEKVDVDLIDDLIGRYAESRTKSFHLEKSWRKFNASGPTLPGVDSKTQGFKY